MQSTEYPDNIKPDINVKSDKVLPKVFKFRASDNVRHNATFILFLEAQGFKIVGDKHEFISNFVLSGDIYGYAIEDNEIKILMRNCNEECYKADPLEEISINYYMPEEELGNDSIKSLFPEPQYVDMLISKKEVIDRAVKALLQIDLNQLSENSANEINLFRLQAEKM